MDLFACDAPCGALTAAPCTSLRRDSEAERWEGFWAEDDSYYARLTRVESGRVEWFRLEDSRALAAASSGTQPAASRASGSARAARVFLIRRRGGTALPFVFWVRHPRSA